MEKMGIASSKKSKGDENNRKADVYFLGMIFQHAFAIGQTETAAYYGKIFI